MNQPTLREISKRLASQVELVAPMLLPGGRRVNGDWVCGDLAGNTGKSLKVNLHGDKAGLWRDWAGGDDQKGDLIDLWRESKGIGMADAIKEVKAYLGIRDPEPMKKVVYNTPPKNTTKPVLKGDAAYKYLTVERDIPPSVLLRFKIETYNNNIAFPSYNPRGELVNRSFRTLPSNGEPKKVWQETGCAPCLFGWQALSQEAYATRTVLLCEGQIDCMTWASWDIPALSIPSGKNDKWLDFEWDNLEPFEKIYLSFDMDGAGKEIADKAIARLGRHRCLIVALPAKDANAALLDGRSEEDARTWLHEAKTPSLPGLVVATELRKRLQEEMRPKPEPFTLPFFRISWPHHGLWFRPGEVTLWVGQTSAGKSTFLNYMTVAILSKEDPAFIASMEVRAETSLRKMIGPFCPEGGGNHDQLAEKFLQAVGHKAIFADIIGYIDQKRLFEMLHYSFRRYGIVHAFIDSLMRIEGLEEDYPAQGKFLNELQEFAKSTGVHVHLVAHSRKIAHDARPGTNDIKGSSLIANNADNIIAIARNPKKDEMRKAGTLKADMAAEMFDAEIRVEKQRETGWVGSFFLNFNPITYAYRRIRGDK